MFQVNEHAKRTLSWWFTQRKKIDMNPPYQRKGRLWSTTDKAFLIDSILNDYDIPKLYLADFTIVNSNLNKKRMMYAIIDGKQRLESMFDFFEGKLVLDKEFIYKDDKSLQLGGLGYSDLRRRYPEIADKFDNYNLTVMSVIADDEGPVNELFVRLNRSKPLTGAEIRNAMAGTAPKIIRTIADHEFFSEYVRFPKSRGQDKNAAAKVLLFEYRDELVETKKANLDKFAKEKDNSQQLELAGRRVISQLDVITELFLPKDDLLGSAGIVPVYYWFVREQHEDYYYYIREYLVKFEDERKRNRTLSKLSTPLKRGEALDQELVDYDNFNRSTNDVRSHEGRHKILESRFEKYLRKASRVGSA